MLQMIAIQKNILYPTASSIFPATNPGIIMLSAIKAVQMA